MTTQSKLSSVQSNSYDKRFSVITVQSRNRKPINWGWPIPLAFELTSLAFRLCDVDASTPSFTFWTNLIYKVNLSFEVLSVDSSFDLQLILCVENVRTP